jgi:hypothetical protein
LAERCSGLSSPTGSAARPEHRSAGASRDDAAAARSVETLVAGDLSGGAAVLIGPGQRRSHEESPDHRGRENSLMPGGRLADATNAD